MFAIAARRMGYRVHTLSPGFDTPTGQVADVEIDADYDDLDAIRAFARGVDVITFEFENVTTAAADAAAEIVPVRPSGHALHVTQQRAREKAFLRLKGFPVTPFESVESLEELATAVERVGLPAILKTAAFGYDGKGQHRITSALDLEPVWGLVGHQTGGARAGRRLRARVLGGGRPRPRRRVRALRRNREHAPRSHPRPVGGAGPHAARRRGRGRRRDRRRSWRSSPTSACCASSSS